MSHKEGGRRPGQIALPPTPPKEPTLSVHRDDSGRLQISANLPSTLSPERGFSADCACVGWRFGAPEFRFYQLHPTDDSRATRQLIVRMEPEAFEGQRQEKINSRFFADMESARLHRRGEPGKFSNLAMTATTTSDVPVAMIDAIWAIFATVGQRASVIFLSASTAEVAAAVRGRAASARLVPELEVTLTANALMDLGSMWQSMAPETAP